MKKIKLITSLSTFWIIGTSVPAIATSCSKNDDSKNNYVLNGLNWSESPTVGTTSYLNQWYITNGDKIVASHDDYEDVKGVNISGDTSSDLGCYFDEAKQMWAVLPTKSGSKKLALDVTLNNGKKFTARADVLVNTNYPWIVIQGDNCTADAATKRVEIKDITKDATLNISASNIPSTAEYIVHALNQDDKVVEGITLINGTLTIPANTFTKDDEEPFIVCSISIKNGDHYIGSTMYINITMEEATPPEEEHGILTFVNWSDITNYLAEPHAPAKLEDGYSVPINVPSEIKKFLCDHVSAEIMAEGVMHYAYEKLYSYALKDAIVKWKTSTDEKTITINSSFTVDYIDKEGNHYDKTGIFNQTLIKDTDTIEDYQIIEITLIDGEITGEYDDSTNEVLALLNAQNPESEDLYGPYMAVAFMGSGGVPYLYLPLNEFNGGLGLASVGSHMFYSVDELKEYASTANFPTAETESITIKTTGEQSELAGGVNGLLNKTTAGEFADGLAQDAVNKSQEITDLVEAFGYAVDNIQGYTMWNYATNLLTAKVVLMATITDLGALFYEKTLDFTISSNNMTSLKVTTFDWLAEDWVTKTYDTTSSSTNVLTMSLQDSDKGWKGYNIGFGSTKKAECYIRIPDTDYDGLIVVN